MTTPSLSLSLNDPGRLVEPLRLMLYGPPKTRKTWWAGTAAETHKVWILDGENNTGILRLLPPEQRARISRIPLASLPGKPSLAMFCTLLFKKGSFVWHLGEQREIMPQHIAETMDDTLFLVVNIKHLTTDDVVVVDSWTKLTSDMSIRYSEQNGTDLFEGEIGKITDKGANDGMDYFRYMDTTLDAILGAFQAMPCHLIVTGHSHQYEVKIAQGNVTTKVNLTQVVSGSGKHSAKVPAYFSDVCYFTPKGDMATEIQTGSEKYRAGGGTNIEPGSFTFPGWSFKDFLAKTDKRPALSLEPNPTGEPFKIYTGAQLREAIATQMAAQRASAPATASSTTGRGIIIGKR